MHTDIDTRMTTILSSLIKLLSTAKQNQSVLADIETKLNTYTRVEGTIENASYARTTAISVMCNALYMPMKQKKYIDIDCPQIVRNYNQHMGGVDLLDSFLGKYKIKMRTKKWYLRLFYHFLDIATINSWLLYRRVGEMRQRATPLKLKDFKFEVAKSLCMCGSSMNKRKGRPSSASNDLIETKRMRANVAILPTRDVRCDGIEHFPIWGKKRQRCKNPGCKGKSFVVCEKCRVELCLNKDKNCFRLFHL